MYMLPMYMCLFFYLYMFGYIHICIVCVCLHVFLYLCMIACFCIYACVYLYAYTCMCTYVRTQYVLMMLWLFGGHIKMLETLPWVTSCHNKWAAASLLQEIFRIIFLFLPLSPFEYYLESKMLYPRNQDIFINIMFKAKLLYDKYFSVWNYFHSPNEWRVKISFKI